MVESVKENPTKMQKNKYDNKEDALVARKKKNNCAQRQRRRRTVERLMAANEERKTPTMRKRGGQRKWKVSVRHRYNRELRRVKHTPI